MSFPETRCTPNPPGTSPADSVTELTDGMDAESQQRDSVNAVINAEAINPVDWTGIVSNGEEQKKAEDKAATEIRIEPLKIDSIGIVTKERANSTPACRWQASLGCLLPCYLASAKHRYTLPGCSTFKHADTSSNDGSMKQRCGLKRFTPTARQDTLTDGELELQTIALGTLVHDKPITMQTSEDASGHENHAEKCEVASASEEATTGRKSADSSLHEMPRNTLSNRSFSNQGCSRRALGGILSCSPIGRKLSRKSCSSQGSDSVSTKNCGDEKQDCEMSKTRLLPQNQLKKEFRLRVSDIILTVESIEKSEKRKKLYQVDFPNPRKAAGTLYECSKKRKLLDISSAVQSVWQERMSTRNGGNVARATPENRRCIQKAKFTKPKNIREMDDRLGKSPEDAAYIMRTRDRITLKILQEPAQKFLIKK